LLLLVPGSCYWSVPMNSRNRDKRMRMYLPGLKGSVILIFLLHFSFGYALGAFDKSIPSTCFETLRRAAGFRWEDSRKFPIPSFAVGRS
jgi:hypothetical protein